jgi:hypothetical protein
VSLEGGCRGSNLREVSIRDVIFFCPVVLVQEWVWCFVVYLEGRLL